MYDIIITNTGYKLIRNSLNSKEDLKLSKFIFALSDKEVGQSTTQLENIVFETYIIEKTFIEDNIIDLRAVIPVDAGRMSMNKIGILNDENRLFAVGNMPFTHIPSLSDSATKEIDITVRINIKDVENVEIIVDPSKTLVTKEFLQQHIDDITKLIEGKLNIEDAKDLIEQIISDIGISSGDIEEIKKELIRLEDVKANTLDIENALQDIIKLIEEQLIEYLEKVSSMLDDKANQSEIDRLETLIKDIVSGEESEFIIPRTTDNPIKNEVYYQQQQTEPPYVTWVGDDWGSWNVEDIEHLKLDSHGSYSGANCRVRTGEGTMIMDFVKEDPRRPYSIVQTRDNKTILDTGYIKENKKHKLYIKSGDRINILGAFKGDVFIEYKGVDSDLRLSAYKNGKVEEIANKRLVEERLDEFTLRDEFITKTGELKDLTTEDKDNLVDAINYLMKTKATNDDIENVLEAVRIVTEDLINKVLALQTDKANKKETGFIWDLETENKDTLVDAINELVERLDKLEEE